MTELGYQRFAAQGGDWGSTISTALGLNHAQRIIGIHLNYIAGRFLFGGTLNQTPDNAVAGAYLAELRAWADMEAGYSHEQSTKPQTLGYALNDSPIGLAAWIVEKDELLTNVMIYWVTETMNSSTRLYYETREQPLQLSPANRVEVPVAMAVFPKEIPIPPRALAERGFNIQRWTVMPRGGHFAAMEQPVLLAQDIREFFRLPR
jgi:pimeloyl-ACP methyl ester carboxylesterase